MVATVNCDSGCEPEREPEEQDDCDRCIGFRNCSCDARRARLVQNFCVGLGDVRVHLGVGVRELELDDAIRQRVALEQHQSRVSISAGRDIRDRLLLLLLWLLLATTRCLGGRRRQGRSDGDGWQLADALAELRLDRAACRCQRLELVLRALLGGPDGIGGHCPAGFHEALDEVSDDLRRRRGVIARHAQCHRVADVVEDGGEGHRRVVGRDSGV